MCSKDTDNILREIHSKLGNLSRHHIQEEFGTVIETVLADYRKREKPHYEVWQPGTQPYALNKWNMRHVYIWSDIATTLTSTEFQVRIPAHAWTLLEFPEGTRFTAPAQNIPMEFLATNEVIPIGFPLNASGQLALPSSFTINNPASNPVAVANDNYTYTHISTNATTTIKSGGGALHTISVLNPGSAWTMEIFDSTTGSGAIIGNSSTLAASDNSFIFDITFTVGLTIVTAGTTPGDITVSWR